jgi:hypothetical protein
LWLRVVVLVVGTAGVLVHPTHFTLALILVLGLVVALIVRSSAGAITLALFAPLPAVLVSHLLIEPGLGGYSVDTQVLSRALMAYLRLSCLAVLSVGFLLSLSLRDLVQLSRSLRLGSWLVVGWSLVTNSIENARYQFSAARIEWAFRRSGDARKRHRLTAAALVTAGIFMTVDMIARASTVAAVSRGRGVDLRRVP